MRRFTDPEGRAWDVVLGRESFGSLLALFIPAAGNDQGPRQTQLHSDGYADAQEELDAMDDDDLTTVFQRSNPKDR